MSIQDCTRQYRYCPGDAGEYIDIIEDDGSSSSGDMEDEWGFKASAAAPSSYPGMFGATFPDTGAWEEINVFSGRVERAVDGHRPSIRMSGRLEQYCTGDVLQNDLELSFRYEPASPKFHRTHPGCASYRLKLQQRNSPSFLFALRGLPETLLGYPSKNVLTWGAVQIHFRDGPAGYQTFLSVLRHVSLVEYAWSNSAPYACVPSSPVELTGSASGTEKQTSWSSLASSGAQSNSGLDINSKPTAASSTSQQSQQTRNTANATSQQPPSGATDAKSSQQPAAPAAQTSTSGAASAAAAGQQHSKQGVWSWISHLTNTQSPNRAHSEAASAGSSSDRAAAGDSARRGTVDVEWADWASNVTSSRLVWFCLGGATVYVALRYSSLGGRAQLNRG